MSTRARMGIVVAVVLAVVAPAAGQSLGDVAKMEAERRRAVRAKGKVYSNENLTPDYTTPVPPPDAAAPTPTVDAAGEDRAPRAVRTPAAAAAAFEAGSPLPDDEQAGVAPPDGPEPQPESDKDESYWRGRSGAIRARIAAQNRQIEALRARMALLTAGTATPERDVAERALARALEDQRFLQEEWARFEQLARERGVPDDWIRP